MRKQIKMTVRFRERGSYIDDKVYTTNTWTVSVRRDEVQVGCNRFSRTPLLSDLRRLYDSRAHSDVLFLLGGDTRRVHSVRAGLLVDGHGIVSWSAVKKLIDAMAKFEPKPKKRKRR